MIRKPVSILGIAAMVMLLGFTATVHACGESRFRLGHGIKYQARQVPLPAQLLVYESEDFQSKTSELVAVGHEVTVVKSHEALLQAASGESFDVVIAPYADMHAVQNQIANSSNPPDLLPMVSRGSDEKRAAKREYSRFVDARASFKKVARMVHRIMQARGQ